MVTTIGTKLRSYLRCLSVLIMMLVFNCGVTEAFVVTSLPNELSRENFVDISDGQYPIWISEKERIALDRDLTPEEIYHMYIPVFIRKGMSYTYAELYARKAAQEYAEKHRYKPWFSGNTVQFYTGWVLEDKKTFEIVRWSYYPATGEIRGKHRYQFKYKNGEIGNLKRENPVQQDFRSLTKASRIDEILRHALKKYEFM